MTGMQGAAPMAEEQAIKRVAAYARALLSRRDGAQDEPVPDNQWVFGIDGAHISIGDLRALAALSSAPTMQQQRIAHALRALIDEADRARRIWRPKGHETATQHARLECAVREARAALGDRAA